MAFNKAARLRFIIVTPVFNSSKYINETITSVFNQNGDFDINYHVQDAGSTDGTLEILREWENKFRTESNLPEGGSKSFTWASEPDLGMYDALNRGFMRILKDMKSWEQSAAIMTWINSDDIFTNQSLKTVSLFLMQNPEILWMTGMGALMNECGSLTETYTQPLSYSQYDLAAGFHDGRKKCFLQQEGTFWVGKLWLKCGGLDPSFRMAGDWDLWRRFAIESSPAKLSCVLGLHRRHSKQLSANMAAYYSEIDCISCNNTNIAHLPKDAITAQYDIARHAWTTLRVPGASFLTFDDSWPYLDFSYENLPEWVANLSGLSFSESWGRWSDQNLAPTVRIVAKKELPLIFNLKLTLRSIVYEKNQFVVIQIGREQYNINPNIEFEDFNIVVKNSSKANSIDIVPNKVVCPKELGWSSDERRLSLGIKMLEISPSVLA